MIKSEVPLISSIERGFAVPIPTFPVVPSIVNRVVSAVNKFTSFAAPVPIFKLETGALLEVLTKAASALFCPPIAPVAALL